MILSRLISIAFWPAGVFGDFQSEKLSAQAPTRTFAASGFRTFKAHLRVLKDLQRGSGGKCRQRPECISVEGLQAIRRSIFKELSHA